MDLCWVATRPNLTGRRVQEHYLVADGIDQQPQRRVVGDGEMDSMTLERV